MRPRTALLATLVLSAFIYAQGPERLTFEIFSIKPADPNSKRGGITPMPGGQTYQANNVPVKLIMGLMYKVPATQIVGGPPWFGSETFDIEAKAAHASSIDDLHTMFQNLLADEFKLKFHKETKEGPVYALVIDKSGSKLKVNDEPKSYKKFTLMPGKPGETIAAGEDMVHFCWYLSNTALRNERPVINKTGLDKAYDFTLSYLPQLPPGFDMDKLPAELNDLPSIFVALKEQLGLRLETQKGPVEYYVIDHVEKPVMN
jgi:uncharacterized protein (TIGR03435 family)